MFSNFVPVNTQSRIKNVRVYSNKRLFNGILLFNIGWFRFSFVV